MTKLNFANQRKSEISLAKKKRSFFSRIEKKWQKKWEEAKTFEANLKKGQKKFFTSPIIPYPSGDPHIGHARTYTRTDIIARFKRLQGYNVLNPVGFHGTGNRIPVLLKHIKNKDAKTIKILKNLYNCSDADIKKLTTPEKALKFFIKRAIKTFKIAGLAIDWRRVFCSIDKEFSKFITWQFETLKRKGYVAKGSHPVVWCPSCESPITQADRAEGEEAIIQDLYIWKCPLESGVILPAATLRPETVFAWTNMFLNPDANYVLTNVGDEKWILGKAAAERLKKQRDDVLIIDEIIPDELIGKKYQNPVTKEWQLVLPGDFVDPSIATGVVASEPSDAPDDHIALEELKRQPKILKRYGLKSKDIDAIKYKGLIEVPKYGTTSAIKICEEMGITSLSQKEKLLEAKKKVYKLQFHDGKLTAVAGKLAGKSIPEAIEAVKKRYSKDLAIIYDSSEPVVCKCSADCYVKILKDQWFLKYGDEKWKNQVKQYMEKELKIYPNFWRARFDAALEWTQNKACARRSGLGTPMPWDKTWVIETLSDSTIYMVYYIISKYVNEGKLKLNQMTSAFFDCTILGEGNLKKVAKETKLSAATLKSIRSDVEYWYPMDWRNSGKDLVSNHLLYYLYNHIAIFPKKYWPKVISVNGFVKISGEKMSKSKGKAVTFKTGIEKYGADVVRTVTSTTASPEQDSDFREEEAENIVRWKNRFYNTVSEIAKAKGTQKPSNIDKWLQSRMVQVIKTVTENLEVLNSREAAQTCLYQLASDFKWYIRRSAGKISKVTKDVANDWVKMVSVFMPHICEELWQNLGNKGFVSEASWPKFDKLKLDEASEKAEETIQNAAKDIYHILRITNKKPKRIFIYVIPPELKIYKEAEDFLAKDFKAKVHVFASNDLKKHDPEGKAKKAKPGKPGIFIE